MLRTPSEPHCLPLGTAEAERASLERVGERLIRVALDPSTRWDADTRCRAAQIGAAMLLQAREDGHGASRPR